MTLENAVFLDYTLYNQDEYAEAVAHYQDSYIVNGFTMVGNDLQPGTLFFKGWHLDFDQLTTYTGNTVEGNTIYMELTSVLGSAIEGLQTTTYIPGEVSVQFLQTTEPVVGSNQMPLYQYTGGAWVLLSNGRIDSINNTKAKLNHNLVLDGSNITVINPISGTGTINTVLQQLQNEIVDLTAGGLTEDIANDKYKLSIDMNFLYTNEEFTGMNMAQVISYVMEDFAAWPHALELVCETSSVGTALLPTVYTAVEGLLTEMYPTVPLSNALKFTMTRARRTGLSGGDILEVGLNAGPTVFFQYDNQNDNDYANVNADAFNPRNMFTGNTDIQGTLNVSNAITVVSGNLDVDNGHSHISGNLTTGGALNVGGNANIDGNVSATNTTLSGHLNATTGVTVSNGDVKGNRMIATDNTNGFILDTGSASQLSTIYPLVVKYLDGTFRMAVTEGEDTSGQYTGIFSYLGTGDVRRVLRFYNTFSNGVLHTTSGGSKQLAYEGTRIAGDIQSTQNILKQAKLNLATADMQESIAYETPTVPFARIQEAHMTYIEQSAFILDLELQLVELEKAYEASFIEIE